MNTAILLWAILSFAPTNGYSRFWGGNLYLSPPKPKPKKEGFLTRLFGLFAKKVKTFFGRAVDWVKARWSEFTSAIQSAARPRLGTSFVMPNERCHERRSHALLHSADLCRPVTSRARSCC